MRERQLGTNAQKQRTVEGVCVLCSSLQKVNGACARWSRLAFWKQCARARKGSVEGPDSAAKALLHILTSQSQATCSA
jgi:hypothetical protein